MRRIGVAVRSVLLGATVMAAFSLAAVPVFADELSELKAQVEILMRKVEELEAKQTETAKAAKTAQEAAERLPLAAPQRVVTSGKDDVKLSVSGQVNRGVLFVDNGDDSEVFHVDNDNSSTRVRFIGKGQLTDDISVGSQIEVQFESNSTAAIRINQRGAAGPNNFTERKLEIYADSKQLGRLWVGQGDTASNGTSEVDLSGTAVVAYSGIADMAGGIAFSDSGTLGPRINQAFSNFDGLSRDDRIRYDSPSFAGFKVSASAIDGNSWDAALRYSAKMPSGLRIGGALAYAHANARRGREQLNGSVSLKFPNGWSFTGAAGRRDPEGRSDDPWFAYGKLGYTFNSLEFGATSVAIDVTRAEEVQADGDEFMSYGAFLVQNFDRIGTEFYIGVRLHELDRPGADFDDIFAVLSGARVKF